MKVIVYTLKNCPACKTLCTFLNILKIDYEVKNASLFDVFLSKHGFNSVPVVEIDGELYQFKSLEEAKLILLSKKEEGGK